MNWLVIIISLLSVMFVAVPDLLDDNEQQNNKNNIITSIELINPQEQQVLESPLLIDLQQQADTLKQVQQEKLKQKQVGNKKVASENELVFGNQVFLLLGIFNQAEQVFVLIKNDQQQLVKAAVGDTLGSNVTLTAITSNTITLANAKQSKKFKLFQRQSHDKSSS